MGFVGHNANSKKRCITHTGRADRKFIPNELYGPDFDLDSNEYSGINSPGQDYNFTFVPCQDDDVPCCDCGRRSVHTNEIIIAIDGACKANGTPDAQARIGVYFAQYSMYNISMELQKALDPRPSNQKAELMACLTALEKLDEVESEDKLSQVVIKADSEFVVKSMTEWIFKWRKNGYKTSKGSPVTNADLFQSIDLKITGLNDDGIEVLFWYVPKARNQEADDLANDVKHYYPE